MRRLGRLGEDAESETFAFGFGEMHRAQKTRPNILTAGLFNSSPRLGKD